MSRKAGVVPEETKKRLLKAAEEEFMEFGFQNSSLRRICAHAQVTTGALYFFFRDKNDLFSHVISPVTDQILFLMKMHYVREFSNISRGVGKGSEEAFYTAEKFWSYYFENKTVCSIILKHLEHPVVKEFFEQLLELMDGQSFLLMQQMAPGMTELEQFTPETVRWISRVLLDGVLYIISQEPEQKQAEEQLGTIIRFIGGGVLGLLNRDGYII